jgi:hypothetical protein
MGVYQEANTSELSIFFYYCENQFSHLSICLAEGLKELGIPCYSNINYWRISDQSEETLFCHHPDIHPDDCSIVVMDNEWIIHLLISHFISSKGINRDFTLRHRIEGCIDGTVLAIADHNHVEVHSNRDIRCIGFDSCNFPITLTVMS